MRIKLWLLKHAHDGSLLVLVLAADIQVQEDANSSHACTIDAVEYMQGLGLPTLLYHPCFNCTCMATQACTAVPLHIFDLKR